MTARRLGFFALVAAALAAALYFSWRWQAAPQAPAATGQAAGAPAPAAARGPGGPGAGPVPVEVVIAATRPLREEVSAVGSVRGNESVVLKPEIAGRIARIAFAEGQRVRKGAVLVELDARVARAEADQARAQFELAKSQFSRTQELASKSFVSSSAQDQAASNLAVAEAAYALAQARLDRYTLRAPFEGVLGLRSVSVGDYVKDGAELVSLEDTSSVRIDFRLPERYVGQVAAGRPLEFTVDALPGKVFTARVDAVDAQVDANGRSLLVRARAPNESGQLKGGMFARVRVLLGERNNAVVLPEEALVPSATGQVVFKLVDGKAMRTPVNVGLRREGQVEILAGVVPGDTVVSAGQIRLQRDGLPVRVVDGAPKSGEAPAAKASATSGAAPGAPAPAGPAPATPSAAPAATAPASGAAPAEKKPGG
jgi:membrane fusion protein (multidrug efflux system)